MCLLQGSHLLILITEVDRSDVLVMLVFIFDHSQFIHLKNYMICCLVNSGDGDLNNTAEKKTILTIL